MLVSKILYQTRDTYELPFDNKIMRLTKVKMDNISQL